MTFIDNILIFIFLSLINTFVSIKLPESFFNYKNLLFKEKAWEKKGYIYQHLFRVRRWKNILPELSDFLKSIFPKKQIMKFRLDYLYRFVLETCRAELAHWCIITSSLIFTLWNDLVMSVILIFIALALNLPFIIIQRYNRPRIINIIVRMESMQKKTDIKEHLKSIRLVP